MKKRQKIILVISCLALLVSLFAVNCFAYYTDVLSYNYNYVSLYEASGVRYVYGQDAPYQFYAPLDGYYSDVLEYYNYSSEYTDPVDIEKGAYVNTDRMENGVLVHPDHSIYNFEDSHLEIKSFQFTFAPYSIEKYSNVVQQYGLNLPYRSLSFNYNGVVYGGLNFETSAIFYVYDNTDATIKEAVVYSSVVAPFGYGQNEFGTLYDSSAGMVGFTDSWVDGVKVSHVEYENTNVSSTLFTGISGVEEDVRFMACPDMPITISQTVSVGYDRDNEFEDILVWCEAIDDSYRDEFDADIEVDFIEVDIFDWLVQAISGFLNIDLFGTGGFTIGSLLLLALGIPILISLLRLFSGG